MALNQIVLVGTVDRAPERRATPDGQAITSFKLKVVRPIRQEGLPAGADLIPIIASRRQADVAAEFRPGEIVAVEGRMVAKTIEQNGQRFKIVEVDAAQVQRIAAAGPQGLAEVESLSSPADTGGRLKTVGVAASPALPSYGEAMGEEPDLDTDIPF